MGLPQQVEDLFHDSGIGVDDWYDMPPLGQLKYGGAPSRPTPHHRYEPAYHQRLQFPRRVI